MAKKAPRKSKKKSQVKKKAGRKKSTTRARKKASKSRAQAKSSTKSKAKTKSKPKSKGKKKDDRLGIRNQHMDFLTYKPDQVRKFYEEMLELKAEVRDTEGLGYLVVKTSPSSSLGFMPPHPEMRGEQPLPREPTIYLMVNDVDKAYHRLSTKGVGFIGPPEEMPWGHRVASTTDPEGRTIMIASPTDKK